MSEHAIPEDLQVWYGVACDGIEFKTSRAAIKVLIERIAKAEAERDALMGDKNHLLEVCAQLRAALARM